MPTTSHLWAYLLEDLTGLRETHVRVHFIIKGMIKDTGDQPDEETHSCTEAPLAHQDDILVVMQVSLKCLPRDKVILYSFLLMALPGPGGICGRQKDHWAEMSCHSKAVLSFLSEVHR